MRFTYMQHQVEYGTGFIEFECAQSLAVVGMLQPPAPLPMPNAIDWALTNPIGSEALFAIARRKIIQNPECEAVIVVSDNTRPVPYYGKDGLIYSIVQVLKQAGFLDQQICILIGAGTHRNMEDAEIENMIGLRAMSLSHIRVVNHEYEQEENLISLGYTRKGSNAVINKRYYEAGLKIVTGLVESHFMAGASGGRKGICPAIVGKETLTLFHGARFLSSVQAADLILEGNPLHEESCEIATMAGCDFLVNVTLDQDKKVTGVFAGDMIKAHRDAVAKINEYVTVSLDQRYDIVLIPAGFVGINHYQAAKAAIEAARAVTKGGKIIIVAKNTDHDPIGGEGYREALRLLAQKGRKGFMQTISESHWKMIQEQWQVQMWCKVFEVIEKENNLYYCALEIPESEYADLPGLAGIKLLTNEERQLPANQAMKLMIEKSIKHAISSSDSDHPTLLLLKDGPYGIPIVRY
ncbi:MAG: nickel-dependent lactate racemase [Saprospiraceae bacterium]|nr:nickel-dependent lactate racemase [Saprospiraceae bacterium]